MFSDALLTGFYPNIGRVNTTSSTRYFVTGGYFGTSVKRLGGLFSQFSRHHINWFVLPGKHTCIIRRLLVIHLRCLFTLHSF